MAHPLLEDPFVAARIDDAVAPFLGRVDDEEIGWMRERLAERLAGDPHAAALLDGAHPRIVDQSGTRVRRFTDAEVEEGGDILMTNDPTGTDGG